MVDDASCILNDEASPVAESLGFREDGPFWRMAGWIFALVGAAAHK